MLLRPWTKRFAMIITAWWLRTSSIFSGQEFEKMHMNFGSLETLHFMLFIDLFICYRLYRKTAINTYSTLKSLKNVLQKLVARRQRSDTWIFESAATQRVFYISEAELQVGPGFSGRVRAGFRPEVDKNFGLNSGLRRAFCLIGAQKYNQNNLATLLSFSDLT